MRVQLLGGIIKQEMEKQAKLNCLILEAYKPRAKLSDKGLDSEVTNLVEILALSFSSHQIMTTS